MSRVTKTEILFMFKFQLAMIIRWLDMRDNMNYSSPLNAVISDAGASVNQKCKDFVKLDCFCAVSIGEFFQNICKEKISTSDRRISEHPF